MTACFKTCQKLVGVLFRSPFTNAPSALALYLVQETSTHNLTNRFSLNKTISFERYSGHCATEVILAVAL